MTLGPYVTFNYCRARFDNTPRWKKVPTLREGSAICITGPIIERHETTNVALIRIEDVVFSPGSRPDGISMPVERSNGQTVPRTRPSATSGWAQGKLFYLHYLHYHCENSQILEMNTTKSNQIKKINTQQKGVNYHIYKFQYCLHYFVVYDKENNPSAIIATQQSPGKAYIVH